MKKVQHLLELLHTKRVSALVVLASIALVLYVPLCIGTIYVSHIQSISGEYVQLPIVGSDSREYSVLAQSILQSGCFSLSNCVPDSFRTPGYPMFIAICISVFHSLFSVIFIQILLVFWTGYLIYIILRPHTSERIALYVMIGFVIEPSVVLHSLLLLSDTLFVFFVVCLYYWTLQKKHFSVSFSLLFGLCMGATILIRPIALFLLPVLVGIHIYINRPTLRSVITMSITMIVGVLLVVGPWMIRNHRVTGVYTVSSITGYNLLYYNVPMFVSYRDGISETDARKQVMQGIDQNNLQDASRSIELQERAMKYITSDIFHYALFHITSTQSFFFGSSIKTAVYTRNLLFSNDVDYASPQVSVVQRVIHGNLLEIAFLIERLLWLCIYLCIACGLYIKKTRRYIAFSIVLILYFALLTGPVSYTRYRLPALPFIAIALGVSIHGMYPHIQKRYQNNKGHQLY